MKDYEWRGNVRELHNVVERLLIMSEADEISAADVDHYVRPGATSTSDVASGSADAGEGENGAVGRLLEEHEDFSDFRDRAEEIFIRRKLNEFEWNVSRTAEAIGIQRSHLYNKLNKYDIERGD